MNPLSHLLEQKGILSTQRLISAFRKVDRKDFVPKKLREEAYIDIPLPIDGDQTISQPSTVAFMLELLQPLPGDIVLDVGSGSGWTTALLAEIIGETGEVWGVEILPELVAFSRERLKKYAFPHAHILTAGKTLGLPTHAPFDKILVSAATPSLPAPLVEQCRIHGRIVIPIETAVWRIDKRPDGDLSIERFEGFRFVPLIEQARKE